jgi:hypothetical protein
MSARTATTDSKRESAAQGTNSSGNQGALYTASR